MYKLSNSVFLNLALESLDNSRRWLEESNHLLFEKRNYGHSCALSIFSIEESAKSFSCMLVEIGSLEESDELIDDIFSSHPIKIALHILFYLLTFPIFIRGAFEQLNTEEIEELNAFFKQFQHEYPKVIQKYTEIRMRGMYVDYKDEKILSPSTLSKNDAEDLFHQAFSIERRLRQGYDKYVALSEKERDKIKIQTEKQTKQFRENWNKIRKGTMFED